MKKIQPEQVGEILQRIYDSEIDLHIGYLWDGGFDYAIYNTPCPISGVPEKEIQHTGEDNICKALKIIMKDIMEKYPNSTFTKWAIDSLINIS